MTIPNNVASIGDYAFTGCSGLTSVTLGTGIKSIKGKAFASCPELADVYCYAENVPNTNSNAFQDSYIEYATLHVPTASINAYHEAEPWKNFKSIVSLDGTEVPKCATPVITVEDGKLKFTCATDGATIVKSISYVGGSINDGEDVVTLATTTTCHITAYAVKDGCQNSDTANYDLELTVGKKGDVNQDGKVSITDAVSVVNIILNAE